MSDQERTIQGDLTEIQNDVENWIREFGVRYFSELTNLAQLVEEVGELARIMSRRFGDQNSKPGETPSELSDELADILFVVTCIANQRGVNLTDAWEKNIRKKTLRDAERHKSNEKLS